MRRDMLAKEVTSTWPCSSRVMLLAGPLLIPLRLIIFLNQLDQHRAETREREHRKLQQKPFAWMNVNIAQHSLLPRRGPTYPVLFSSASHLKGCFPLLLHQGEPHCVLGKFLSAVWQQFLDQDGTRGSPTCPS